MIDETKVEAEKNIETMLARSTAGSSVRFRTRDPDRAFAYDRLVVVYKDLRRQMLVPVILDVETTGVHDRDEIVEISARFGLEEEAASFGPIRCHPTNAQMSIDATAVHGITASDLASCESVDIVVSTFWEWLAQLVRDSGRDIALVAHNGFALDFKKIAQMSFKSSRAKRAAESFMHVPCVDTFRVTRKALPRTPGKETSIHDSMNDVLLLRDLLKEIIDKDPSTELPHAPLNTFFPKDHAGLTKFG